MYRLNKHSYPFMEKPTMDTVIDSASFESCEKAIMEILKLSGKWEKKSLDNSDDLYEVSYEDGGFIHYVISKNIEW